MALNKETEVLGISTNNAYYQVISIKELGKSSASFVVQGFTDTNKNHKFYENEFAFQYDLNGLNPIAQAYEHLKTLDEFANATDV